MYALTEKKVMYKYVYRTPSGFDNMIMNSDGENLTALFFENSKDVSKLDTECEEKFLPIFKDTIKWLDMYFNGEIPNFVPKYKVGAVSPFRRQVFDIMNKIRYGKTVTYNDIAKEIARKWGIGKMSAQAVGGAVGANPICIIIPCHRVVGSNGSLTGYGGGIQNKIRLLELEGNDMLKFTVPKKGTAL